MRHAVVALALMAALTPLQAAAAGKARTAADPSSSYTYRILSNPTTGDAFMFRPPLQQSGQQLVDRLFAPLQKLLGGDAPKLNFVPAGSQFLLAGGDTSANIGDHVGAPVGTINVDPLAVEALINENSPYHSVGVNAMPHEMAHLRQLAGVLASIPDREGGAQAFTDMVTPLAAAAAKTPYTFNPAFDGAYAQYVKDVQSQKGRDWILGGQFGRTPVAWP